MSGMFNELLEMTSQQQQQQRLLFLFAAVESSDSAQNGEQRSTITPRMCVDKRPDELSSFDELVNEADGINSDWQFVLIAGLSGEKGQAPSSEDAEPYLNKMTHDLSSGADLSRYLVLDRNEQKIVISAPVQ